MTAFPGAIKSYTRQEDVSSPVVGVGFINASDINDLQEEIEAIEIELGTTPSSAYHATIAARFAEIESDGNLFVASGKTIGLEGASGNTYLKYNSTDNTLDTYIDGVVVEALASAQLNYIETAHSNDDTLVMVASRGYFVKIYVPRKMELTELRAGITSVAAGGKFIHMAVYNDAGDELIQTGDIAADVTGVVVDTVASTVLLPGVYWLAISSDDTPTITATGGSDDFDLGEIRGIDYCGYATLGSISLPTTIPDLTAMGEVPYIGAYK